MSEQIVRKITIDGNEKIAIYSHVNGNRQYVKASDIMGVSQVRTYATGCLIDWTSPKIFGSEAAPLTCAAINFDIISQKVEQQWVFHQAASQPTFPAGTVIQGTYNANAINFIRIEYVSPTRINVTINQ